MHLILHKTLARDHTKWALNIHAELPSGYESLINATPIDAVLYRIIRKKSTELSHYSIIAGR